MSSRILLFMFTVFCLSALSLSLHATFVHVFIHGTTLPGFLLLNQAGSDKSIKFEGRFADLVDKTRDDMRFYDDSIMLDRGLVQIDKKTIAQCKNYQLSKDISRQAAIQAIAAYDDFVDQRSKNFYYLYGWSGILSDANRKNESEKLYDELIKIKNKFSKDSVHFFLHGHSHGGTIILYLGLQEETKKQNLIIDHAVLYETPVQIETANYCLSPVFKNISLIYSKGDFIQTADCFSTSTGKSYRTFSELIKLDDAQNRVNEVLLKVDGDDQKLHHRSYFFFDAYYGITTVHRDIFSKNSVIDFINPLPLVIFAPVFMMLMQSVVPKQHVVRAELDIRTSYQACVIQVTVPNRVQLYSVNLWQSVMNIKDRISRSWRPYAKTSDVKKLFWLGEHLILR